MIYNEPNSNYQRRIAEYLEHTDIILNPYMKMQSIKAVKSVMDNFWIAYIPIFAIRKELKFGSLVQVKTEIGWKNVYICVHIS